MGRRTRSTANRGVAWERRLELWHRDYRRDGLAYVARHHPEVKQTGRLAGAQIAAVRSKKGAPDFQGVLQGGRSLLFDAKDCTQARWPLGALDDHQARDLEAHHLRGGLSFVALQIGGRGFVLPWEQLGPVYWRWREGAASRGEASLTPAEVEDLGRPIDPVRGWLPAVLELAAREAS